MSGRLLPYSAADPPKGPCGTSSAKSRRKGAMADTQYRRTSSVMPSSQERSIPEQCRVSRHSSRQITSERLFAPDSTSTRIQTTVSRSMCGPLTMTPSRRGGRKMGREARVRKPRQVDDQVLYAAAKELSQQAQLLLRAKRAGLVLPGVVRPSYSIIRLPEGDE